MDAINHFSARDRAVFPVAINPDGFDAACTWPDRFAELIEFIFYTLFGNAGTWGVGQAGPVDRHGADGIVPICAVSRPRSRISTVATAFAERRRAS